MLDEQSEGIKDFVNSHVESNVGYAVGILVKLSAIPEVHQVLPDIDEVFEVLGKEDPETGDYLEMSEFHVVSKRLYELLKEKGELVAECLGMRIWGRYTSGQHIYMDAVIQDIWDDIK